MTRARGRGRHKPPPGRTEDYLYHATGKSQLDAHQEQLDAADDAQGPPDAPRSPLAPEHGAGWERLIAPPRSTPRATTGLEERRYGAGDYRGIPGGIQHVDANAPVTHEKPLVAEPLAEFRGMMAHGVKPEDVGHYQREMHPERPYHPHYKDLPPAVVPVPVYVVEGGAGPKPRARCAFRHITAPAAGSEPVSISGAGLSQSLVQILNEDSTHNCRVGELSDLAYDAANSTVIGGARLPANATGYTVLRTQSPLYVVSETSSTVVLSIIQEYEVAEAG